MAPSSTVSAPQGLETKNHTFLKQSAVIDDFLVFASNSYLVRSGMQQLAGVYKCTYGRKGLHGLQLWKKYSDALQWHRCYC